MEKRNFLSVRYIACREIAEDCLHAWILNDGTVYGGGTSCSTSLARRLSLQTDRHTTLRQVVQLPLNQKGEVDISQCVALSYVFGSMQCQVVVQTILRGMTNSHDLLWVPRCCEGSYGSAPKIGNWLNLEEIRHHVPTRAIDLDYINRCLLSTRFSKNVASSRRTKRKRMEGFDSTMLEYYRMGICDFFTNRMRISLMSRRVARASRVTAGNVSALSDDEEGEGRKGRDEVRRVRGGSTNRVPSSRKRRLTCYGAPSRSRNSTDYAEDRSTEEEDNDEWLPSPHQHTIRRRGPNTLNNRVLPGYYPENGLTSASLHPRDQAETDISCQWGKVKSMLYDEALQDSMSLSLTAPQNLHQDSLLPQSMQQHAHYLQQLQLLAHHGDIVQQLAEHPEDLPALLNQPERLQHLPIHPDLLRQFVNCPDALQQLANPEMLRLLAEANISQLLANPQILQHFTNRPPTTEDMKSQGTHDDASEVLSQKCDASSDVQTLAEQKEQLLQHLYNNSEQLQQLSAHPQFLHQLINHPEELLQLAQYPEVLQDLEMHSDDLEQLVNIGKCLQHSGIRPEQIQHLANQAALSAGSSSLNPSEGRELEGQGHPEGGEQCLVAFAEGTQSHHTHPSEEAEAVLITVEDTVKESACQAHGSDKQNFITDSFMLEHQQSKESTGVPEEVQIPVVNDDEGENDPNEQNFLLIQDCGEVMQA